MRVTTDRTVETALSSGLRGSSANRRQGEGVAAAETALIAFAFPEMNTAEMASSSGGKEKHVTLRIATSWVAGTVTKRVSYTMTQAIVAMTLSNGEKAKRVTHLEACAVMGGFAMIPASAFPCRLCVGMARSSGRPESSVSLSLDLTGAVPVESVETVAAFLTSVRKSASPKPATQDSHVTVTRLRTVAALR
jgi:hypothetical protein